MGLGICVCAGVHIWVCTRASIEVRGLHQVLSSVTFNLTIIVFKHSFVFVYVHGCVCVHVCGVFEYIYADAHTGWKKASDPWSCS